MSAEPICQTFNDGSPPTHHLTHLEGVELEGPVEVAIRARSDTMLMLEVRMSAGSRSNPHRHSSDSTGYLLSGRVRAVVDEVRTVLSPGDAFVHPRGVEHFVEALEDSHWLEIKSPPLQPF